jgi:hypothetical protein
VSVAGQDTGDARVAVDRDEADRSPAQTLRHRPISRPAHAPPAPKTSRAATPPYSARADLPRNRPQARPHPPRRRRPREGADAPSPRAVRTGRRPVGDRGGLEAHGVTDRTAARFRHRDVFSLAEEMYARVPRDEAAAPHSDAVAAQAPRADWAVLALLPGVLCAAAVTGVRLTDGRLRLTVAVVGVLAVALGCASALGRGPLSTPPGTHAWRTPPARACGPAGCSPTPSSATACSAPRPRAAPTACRPASRAAPGPRPPHRSWPSPWPAPPRPGAPTTSPYAPGRKLATSRGLEDFADSVQPLLLGTFALFLCALTVLLALCGAALGEPAAYAQALTLGALLLLARLLTVHGFTHAPTVASARRRRRKRRPWPWTSSAGSPAAASWPPPSKPS